jgi:hypothetical protein
MRSLLLVGSFDLRPSNQYILVSCDMQELLPLVGVSEVRLQYIFCVLRRDDGT